MPRNFDTSEFKRRLAKLPVAVKKHYSAALLKDAEELVDLAKMFAPKQSGKLAASLTIHETETGGVIVQADALYARFVEFGTQAGQKGKRVGNPGAGSKQHKSAGRKSYRTHSGTEAHPFFWTAYRTLRRRFKARRSRAISAALKDI